MSYDNAEPKVLKTLNSDGQVLDDAGNVINDTSDYWVQLYNQTEPKPDKILKSDGSVVDSSGTEIQATTEFNLQKYNQAEPIPAKYLHSDGTIDENPGSGGSADLEDNHQTTIDVSTYTEPVEVEPEQGKDGMKKNTITLSNIPNGTTAYSWGRGVYFPFSVAPATMTQTEIENQMCFYIKSARVGFESASVMSLGDYLLLTFGEYTSLTYEKTSDDKFTISVFVGGEEFSEVFELISEENFTLWQLP